MRIECLILTILACHGFCQDPPGDKNDKWRLNNQLLEHIDGFYYDFAITQADLNDTSKRFASIVSLAMSVYASSGIKDPEKRLEDAVCKTRSMLDQSADIISSQMRARLILLRTIIDPPINDVKLSCPQDVNQDECIAALNKYREANEKACPGFSNHVDLYNTILDERTTGYRADFMKALDAESTCGDDEDAIQFFTNIVTDKYPALFPYIIGVFDKLVGVSYPCSALKLPTFDLACVS